MINDSLSSGMSVESQLQRSKMNPNTGSILRQSFPSGCHNAAANQSRPPTASPFAFISVTGGAMCLPRDERSDQTALNLNCAEGKTRHQNYADQVDLQKITSVLQPSNGFGMSGILK